MKCPSPWPFPKSHWICSQCNLDCILVPFCHCSTNPFPPLSRRYQIWSEKLHWTEWAKTVIVINVVSCFWPHFKRQGSVGYGSAFFFFFLHNFPRSTSSEKQMHLCIFLGLLKCRPLEETLWKDHHLLSLITHPEDAAHRQPYCHASWTHICGCLLRDRGRESLLWLLPQIIKQIFLVVFFLENFSQILKGSTDTPKVKNCWSPPTCTPPRSWHPCHRH